MLVHRSCKTQVYLDLGSVFKFIAAFGVTSKGLKTNLCEVIQSGNEGPSSFFCAECNVPVPLTDVQVQCMQGGEYIEVADAVRSESAGGMYCRAHGQEYFDDCKKLNVAKFTLSKISGSR